jgi:SOS response regulatory protein OraA/RecX
LVAGDDLPYRSDDPPPGSATLQEIHETGGSVVLVLDTGETFELAPESVPQNLPEIGGSIDSPLRLLIIRAAERKQVARRLFTLLDRRLWPVAALRRKMVDAGFSVEAIEAVLEQMQEQGIYSDRHFAEAWCADCLRARPVGRRYLAAKLREKQVSGPVATEVIDRVLDPAHELALAVTAAEKRWSRLTGPVDKRAENKVVRHLQNRGFEIRLAVQAARRTRPRTTDAEDEENQ